MLFSGARTARMINIRKRPIKNKNMQFHRRRTSKYAKSTDPKIRPVRGAGNPGFGPAPNRCRFQLNPLLEFDVFGPGQAGGRFGRFRDPPGTTAPDDPIPSAGRRRPTRQSMIMIMMMIRMMMMMTRMMIIKMMILDDQDDDRRHQNNHKRRRR